MKFMVERCLLHSGGFGLVNNYFLRFHVMRENFPCDDLLRHDLLGNNFLRGNLLCCLCCYFHERLFGHNFQSAMFCSWMVFHLFV